MTLKLVCFFGPDGVGKSTQVEIVNRYLSSKGYPTEIVWIRGPHTLSFLLSTVLLKTGRSKKTINPFGREKNHLKIGPNQSEKTVWALIEFISVLPLIFLKVLVPIKKGTIIIADRYVLDSIVSIAYNIDDYTFINGRLSRILLKLIPDNSLFFHLDTDYSTLCERRERLVEPKEFIDFQKKCYNFLGKIVNSRYLDTSNESVKEISSKIMAEIYMKINM